MSFQSVQTLICATAEMRAQNSAWVTMSDVLKCREIGFKTISIHVID